MKPIQIIIAVIGLTFTTELSAQTGIGTISPDPDFALHVKANGTQDPLKLEGLLPGTTETSILVTDANGRLTYRPAADLIPSSSSLWINTLGDISPESNRPVAIGQTSVASSVILDVNGNQRLEGVSRLQFRGSQNFIYSPTNNNYWYFKGNNYVSFRNASNSDDVLTVRATSSRVGIQTAEPDVPFHVATTSLLTSAGGGVARIGEASFVGLSQNQIGAYNGGAPQPIHIQQFGSSLVVGASNPGTSLLDARGSVRVGNMPPVTSDNSLVTTNAVGDIRRITWANAITALGDEMGDHTATQNIDIEAEHQIQFNSTSKYINRFGADIDLVNLSGGVHVHAEDLIITNEAIGGIAHFEGSTRRVGFGDEIAPAATIHVDPAGSDFPLRLEGVPLAPTGTYRRLIIDGNRYVYRGRSNVNRNGLTSDGPPKNGSGPAGRAYEELSSIVTDSFQGNGVSTAALNYGLQVEEIRTYFPHAVDTLAQELKINYEALAAISFTASKELHAENMQLRQELVDNQHQQQVAIQTLEARLTQLADQLAKISSATGVELVQNAESVKACSHKH